MLNNLMVMEMKTKYIKPESVIVNVKLYGSVLDTGDVYGGSKGAGGEAWGKENNMEWDLEEEEVSLWGDNDEEEDY